MDHSRLVGMGWAFWAAFALFGAALAVGTPWMDVLLGIAGVFLGVSHLIHDIERRRLLRERAALDATLGDIREWLQREYRQVARMEAKYENRFFHAARNRAEIARLLERSREVDHRLERNQRELVRKILEVDNKLNQISRALLQQTRSGRGQSR